MPNDHTPQTEKARLCWRHQARLFWAAWGSLLDLTGRQYPRLAKRIFADARRCPRCSYVTTPPEGSTR